MDIRLSSGRSQRRIFALGLIVLGVFASGAAAASNASAAQWKIAGSPLTGSATYSSSSAKGLTLAMEVGTTKIRMPVSGVESLNSSIFNSEGSASSQGSLRLTGVTVAEPAVCAVEGGAIQTVGLKSRLILVNGVTYERFEPSTGTTLFTFKLVKGQGACPLTGTYSVTGWIAAEVSGIGTEQITHELTFSRSIDSATGGGLKFGAKPFEFAGSLAQTLTGTHAGQTWSAS